jgi:hypothetical protein
MKPFGVKGTGFSFEASQTWLVRMKEKQRTFSP